MNPSSGLCDESSVRCLEGSLDLWAFQHPVKVYTEYLMHGKLVVIPEGGSFTKPGAQQLL